MPNNPGSISQSNAGSMAAGQQIVIGNNNQQIMKTDVDMSSDRSSKEEVAGLLTQLECIIQQSSELPEGKRNKAVRYLNAVQAEIEEDEPNKQLVAGNLERVAKTLQEADRTVEAGKGLWQETAPLIKEIAGWLGTAAKTLWILLP